ncbi:hypothetical protein MTO96_040470 [Rhipicephalus appendiculatus]
MEPSPASLPQQAPPSTCSFAPCLQTSDPTSATVPHKVRKDGEKKRLTKSPNTSKSEKNRTKPDSSDRNKHKHPKGAIDLCSLPDIFCGRQLACRVYFVKRAPQ